MTYPVTWLIKQQSGFELKKSDSEPTFLVFLQLSYNKIDFL